MYQPAETFRVLGMLAAMFRSEQLELLHLLNGESQTTRESVELELVLAQSYLTHTEPEDAQEALAELTAAEMLLVLCKAQDGVHLEMQVDAHAHLFYGGE